MHINRDKMEYRKKASGIILNDENSILLVQLNEYKDTEWNVPGGGVEEGEEPATTILRELEEELGTNKFEIIEQSGILNRYEFPDALVEQIIKEGRNYRGQEQVQFILRFTGDDSDIKLQEDEVRKYKRVQMDDLKLHLIFPNQWENIVKVIELSTVNIKPRNL